MSNKFNIGDVVTLTCGGDLFTIITCHGDGIYACHGRNGAFRRYSDNVLVKVEYHVPTVVTDDGKKAHFLCNWAEHNIDKFHTNMEWYTSAPIDPPEQGTFKITWVGIYVFR